MPLQNLTREHFDPAHAHYNVLHHGSYMPWQGQAFLDFLKEFDAETRRAYTPFGGGPRIAGLSGPSHERTLAYLNKYLDEEATRDEQRMAKEGIQRSLHSPGHHDLIAPYLAKATGAPRGYIEDYLQNVTRPMMRVLDDEFAENLMEKTLPGIDNAFTRAGGFYSGARGKAIREGVRDSEKHLRREQAKLLTQAEHNARHFAEGAAQRNLHAADVLSSSMFKSDQSKLAAAQAAQNLAAYKQNAASQRLSAAEHQQERERAVRQNEINQQIAEHDAQTQYPLRMAQARLQGAVSVPSLGATTASFAPTPPPQAPVPQDQIRAILQQGAVQNSLQSLKKGGRIKRKFSNGGMPQINEVQHTPETQEMAYLASRMGKTLDPRIMMMGKMAAAVGPGVGPSQRALSAGFDEGLDAYSKTFDDNAARQARAAQALAAIQKSRQDQHEVLVKYQQHQQQLAEQKRLHDSQIAMNQAHSRYYDTQAAEKQMPKPKLGKEDRKILEDYAQIQQSAPELLHELNTMKRIAPNITTGPWAGYLPISTPGIGKTADIEEFNKSSNKLVMAAANNLKGRTGIGMAQMIEKGKPNTFITPEGNVRNIDSSAKVINDKLKVGEFISEAWEHGILPTKALAVYSKYERLKHKNPDLNPFEMLGIKDKEWIDDDNGHQDHIDMKPDGQSSLAEIPTDQLMAMYAGG